MAQFTMDRGTPTILESSLLVGGTMMMALSVYFDAWWHEAFGRESFWIPPHLGIYAGLFISLAGFVWIGTSWRWKLNRGLWVYATGIIGVVAAGYADELWHQRFGVEKFGTLEAVWSPTHVAALLGGITASLGIIFYLSDMSRAKGAGDGRLAWLLAAQFGVLVSVVTLLVLPLGPETRFRVLGVWGAPTVAFIILTTRFFGSALSEKPWALTLITSYNWTGNAVLLYNHTSAVLLMGFLAVGLVPPVLGDLIIQKGRKAKAVKKAYTAAGVVWGVIFGSFFYPLTNLLVFADGWPVLDITSLTLIGVSSSLASTVAGFLAGTRSERWSLSRTVILAVAEVRTSARA